MNILGMDKYSFWFSLRVSLSIVISWYLCYLLAVTNLSAAIITAVVISITQTHGESLAKAFTRLLGTLFGATFVLFVSGPGLVDGYVYIAIMIVFILVCIAFASTTQGNQRYFYILASITVVTTGLVGVNSATLYGIYTIVQDRVSGIIIALIVCEILNFIIPGKNAFDVYSKNLYTFGKEIRKKVVENLLHYQSLKEYEYIKLLSQYYQKNKSLEISNLFYSTSGENSVLNILKNINIQTVKIGLSVTQFSSIVLWGIKHNILSVENQKRLEHVESKTEFDINKIKTENKQEYNQNVLNAVNEIIKNGFAQLDWLIQSHDKKEIQEYNKKRFVFMPILWDNAFYNVLRAAVGMTIICLLWFFTYNENGINTLIFASLLYTLLTMLPIVATKALRIVFVIQVVIFVLGFFVQFYILPSIQSFEGYIIPMFVLFFFLALGFYKGGIVGISFLFSMTFINSYVSADNLPSYNVQDYLNSGLSNLFAVFIIMLTYRVFKEQSNTSLSNKIIREFSNEARHVIKKREFQKFRVDILYSMPNIDFSNSKQNLDLLVSLDMIVNISSLLNEEHLKQYYSKINEYLDKISKNKPLTKKDYELLYQVVKNKQTNYFKQDTLNHDVVAKLIFLDFKLSNLLENK